jgi:hypothetical protein
MNSNLRISLASFLLSLSIFVQAQHDYRDGYVITNGNDTIHGLIDFKDYKRNSQICQFKKSLDDSPTIFTPKDIIAYRINDDRYYVTKTITVGVDQEDMFLEYLIKGQANIYYYRDHLGDHYLIDKPGNPLKEVVYKEEEIVIDHVNRLKESTRHIGVLKAYLSDCPEIFYRIESLKKPDHDNMIALAKDYHQKICNNDSCIIYAQKKPPVRIVAEPIVGFYKYKYSEQFYLGTGALLHFWLPRSSERLYFTTGYLYSKAVIDKHYNEEGVLVGKEISIHRIPLHFEYIFPGQVFKPRFSYGINLFKPDDEGGLGFFGTCGAGFLIKTINEVYLSARVDTEWTPILASLVVDSKIEVVSYSLNMGIFFRF